MFHKIIHIQIPLPCCCKMEWLCGYGEGTLKVLHCRGGGTRIESWHGDVPQSWPLLSGQSALPSIPIYHQCTTHVPPIFKFQKNFVFSAQLLAKISALQMQIFQFCFQDPSFFKENLLPISYLWAHTHTHTQIN